ncbi:MAG: hypothetical protein NTU79_24340 [Planctomycetota bacterium]|nr:hypothetical protein [Planctomycetota bacterium]
MRSHALDKPLLVITTPRWARHESNLDRPDTNWEKESEASLSTDNQNGNVDRVAEVDVPPPSRPVPRLRFIGTPGTGVN